MFRRPMMGLLITDSHTKQGLPFVHSGHMVFRFAHVWRSAKLKAVVGRCFARRSFVVVLRGFFWQVFLLSSVFHGL